MIEKEKIERAVALLLEGIGEDVNREGLKETPKRIARMYEEIFAGLTQTPEPYLNKTFSVEDSGMVLEKDIVFYSTCEHHLLPFYGKAHIAYLPDGKVAGLSKLARTVEVYARRPQLQERLTVQIADALRGDGNGGSGAYVHDHARCEEAGNPDRNPGNQRKVRRRERTPGGILADDGQIRCELRI